MTEKKVRRPRVANSDSTDEAADTGSTDTAEARSFEPIAFGELIEDLPATNRTSKTTELVNGIVEKTADGKWIRLELNGRQVSSVQSSVQNTASKMGVKIQTRTRPNEAGEKELYVRVAPADEN